MKDKSPNDNSLLLLICSCGCKAQLQMQIVNELLMVDTRVNGRHRWIGVTVKSAQIAKLKRFLNVAE